MAPGLVTALMLVAVVCGGVFAGAAIYINLVEHPARMEGGPAIALTEWGPSYRRATLMQAPLALVGAAAALAAWGAGAGRGWLAGEQAQKLLPRRWPSCIPPCRACPPL